MTHSAQKSAQEQTYAEAELSEFEKLLQRDFKFKSEYIPFLGDDTQKVTLSPGIVVKYFCKPTKKGFVCTEEQAVKFIKLCTARKLNPWEGDAYIVGYDGDGGPEFTLITAIQALLKRAEAHPQYDGMESGVVVWNATVEATADLPGDYVPEDCMLVGGWARVHMKNHRVPIYKRLDLKVFDQGRSRWAKDKAGMIAKCAEADALRTSFPSVVGGLYVQGEMPDAEGGDEADKPKGNGRLANANNDKASGEVPAPPMPANADPSPLEGAAAPSNAPPQTTHAGGAAPPTGAPSVQTFLPSSTAAGVTTAPVAGRRKGGRPGPKVDPKKCVECGTFLKDGACPSCGFKVAGADAPTDKAELANPATTKTSAPVTELSPEEKAKEFADNSSLDEMIEEFDRAKGNSLQLAKKEAKWTSGAAS